MKSFGVVCLFTENDNVLQASRSSFDMHIQEIVGTLVCGASVIMLHPHGLIIHKYVALVFKNKRIS